MCVFFWINLRNLDGEDVGIFFHLYECILTYTVDGIFWMSVSNHQCQYATVFFFGCKSVASFSLFFFCRLRTTSKRV